MVLLLNLLSLNVRWRVLLSCLLLFSKFRKIILIVFLLRMSKPPALPIGTTVSWIISFLCRLPSILSRPCKTLPTSMASVCLFVVMVKFSNPMNQKNLTFDKVRDVQKVEPFGFVDLAKANSMNSIPANLNAEQLHFNEIDDPNSIAGRPSDEFEAMQAAKAIVGYKSPEKKADESAK